MFQLINRLNAQLNAILFPAKPVYWEPKYELIVTDHVLRRNYTQTFSSLKDAMEVVEVQELMYDPSKKVLLQSTDMKGNIHILRITNRREDVPEIQYDL